MERARERERELSVAVIKLRFEAELLWQRAAEEGSGGALYDRALASHHCGKEKLY